MKTKAMLALLLTISFFSPSFAHEEMTGDPTHDENHVPALAEAEQVEGYSKNVPIVLLFLAGLFIFAFAMGIFVWPHCEK